MNTIKIKHLTRIFVFAVVGTLFTSNSNAQEVLGSEFSYQCTGPNSYSFTYYYYYNCNAASLPTTIDLDWLAPSCAGSGIVTLTQQSKIDVTEICFSQQSSCNGGTGSYGVERVAYTGALTLVAGCTDITFSNSFVGRGGATLSQNVDGGNQTLYVENFTDNSAVPCNNSPQFLSQPKFYTLTNGPNDFHNEAFDPDGDSLYYSIVPALAGPSTSVIYKAGYTSAQPFGTAIPYSINSSNGTVSYTGSIPAGKNTLAIQVEEFRNGVLIGSVIRDWTLQHMTSTNLNVPTLSGFNGGANYVDTVCPSNPSTYCRTITITDGDVGDNINAIILDTGSNFSFSTVGTNPLTVNLCWNTGKPMVGGTYYFGIRAFDDACPLSLRDTSYYSVTIHPGGLYTDTYNTCDSLAWIDGNTYYASNTTAQHIITNGAASGCDSIITLDLTLNMTALSVDTYTECDSLTWIDGNTYYSSNTTAQHTITNGAASGCDSIVDLNLTVNATDTSVSQAGNNISSNQSIGSYQWLNCDSNMAMISGATSQLFTAPASGNYAVQVTNNGCVDTSACISITLIGIEEMASLDYVVYPNPTSELINLRFEKLSNGLMVQLVTIEGKLILEQQIESHLTSLDLSGLTDGVYLIRVIDDSGINIHQIVKQ
jgi:hypothetical protein